MSEAEVTDGESTSGQDIDVVAIEIVKGATAGTGYEVVDLVWVVDALDVL